MIRVGNIQLPLDGGEDAALALALKKIKAGANQVIRFRIGKKSVDARDKQNVHFVVAVDLEIRNEDRILVNSPAVATYDLKPEMSAPEVSERLDAAITPGEYDVIIINFANPDMVGHTGVLEAAIKAVERIDQCVGAAVEAIRKTNGVLFICADHGNCEQMVDYATGEPHTAHTTNPVPFILFNYDPAYTLREGGRLCDIAPTLLQIMDLPQPAEMTGECLIK